MKVKHVLSVVALCILVASCGGNSSKRVVSETPINTEVLGLKLCEESDEYDIISALEDFADKNISVFDRAQNGAGLTIRTYVSTWSGVDKFYYGGCSWNNADVYLDADNRIYSVSVTNSFEKIERAKEQYDSMVALLIQKYGMGNIGEQYTLWTDDTNIVRVSYYTSTTLGGDEKNFCQVFYTNIALAEAVESSKLDAI